MDGWVEVFIEQQENKNQSIDHQKPRGSIHILFLTFASYLTALSNNSLQLNNLNRIKMENFNHVSRPLPIKIAILGDPQCGKTSLLLQFVKDKEEKVLLEEADMELDQSSSNNSSNSMDFLSKIITLDDDKRYIVTLVDTNGSSKHDKIRPASYYYPMVDAFILCYDVTDRTSFNNISEKWIYEVQKHCPSAKVFIVGTKLDIASTHMNPVTPVEARQMGSVLPGVVNTFQLSSSSSIQEYENLATFLFHQLVLAAAEKYGSAGDKLEIDKSSSSDRKGEKMKFRACLSIRRRVT